MVHGQKVTTDPESRNEIGEGVGVVTSDSLAAESYNDNDGDFGSGNRKAGVSEQPSYSSTTSNRDTSGATELGSADNARDRRERYGADDDNEYNTGSSGNRDSGRSGDDYSSRGDSYNSRSGDDSYNSRSGDDSYNSRSGNDNYNSGSGDSYDRSSGDSYSSRAGGGSSGRSRGDDDYSSSNDYNKSSNDDSYGSGSGNDSSRRSNYDNNDGPTGGYSGADQQAQSSGVFKPKGNNITEDNDLEGETKFGAIGSRDDPSRLAEQKYLQEDSQSGSRRGNAASDNSYGAFQDDN